jgi:hypothetical protein
MNRRPWSVVAALVLAVSAATALVSCKQGEGDRCQVNSDCEDGLICGSAGGGSDVKTCREPATGRDASVPLDGGPGALDAGE